MKTGIKMAVLGTVTFGIGMFTGYKACQALISAMLKDKEYINSKILPIIEQEFGKDKLERIGKILYESDDKGKHNVVLASRSDAEEVLTQMLSLLEDYKVVTVAELYDLVGITSELKDNQVGWTDLKNAIIKRVYTGYLLDLPTPQPIK